MRLLRANWISAPSRQLTQSDITVHWPLLPNQTGPSFDLHLLLTAYNCNLTSLWSLIYEQLEGKERRMSLQVREWMHSGDGSLSLGGISCHTKTELAKERETVKEGSLSQSPGTALPTQNINYWNGPSGQRELRQLLPPVYHTLKRGSVLVNTHSGCNSKQEAFNWLLAALFMTTDACWCSRRRKRRNRQKEK